METILLAIIAALAAILTAVGGMYLNWKNGQKVEADTEVVEINSITKASADTVLLIQNVMASTLEPMRERIIHAENEIRKQRFELREQADELRRALTLAETYRMGIILLSNQIVELGHTPVFFLEGNRTHGEVHLSETQRTVSSASVQRTTETVSYIGNGGQSGTGAADAGRVPDVNVEPRRNGATGEVLPPQ
jgi:hypothetical protein